MSNTPDSETASTASALAGAESEKQGGVTGFLTDIAPATSEWPASVNENSAHDDAWWEYAKAQIYAQRIAGDAEEQVSEGTPVTSGTMRAHPKTEEDQPDSWWELAKTLFYALLIALFVRTFFFQPYNIPSGSMESTLLVGDYLFVEKFAYGYSKYSFPFGRFLPSFGRIFSNEPHRGDVIVFALPSDPSTVFIKRLIGLPGDRIQMIDDTLYINDKPVPKIRVSDYVEDENGYEHHIARYRETLPNGKSYYVLNGDPDALMRTTPVFIVPAGHYFMMGDNRDDSDDSRGIVGYLPAENLVGKAEFKFFSIDDSKTHWWQFWTWPWAIRYDRLFTFIN